jgi:amidase
MSTWILRLDPTGSGPRVAVKDLIDVAGLPTTAGSPAVAATAGPAEADASCVRSLLADGAVVVGKANLHELAFGGTGINQWFGTPENPFDPARIPGGSSSGSAVAVAVGEADLALGTDTAGSVRTPSACCGTVGLKTTFGRVPVDGVRPLAPSLDSVGPMARDVGRVVAAMAMLEPGFALAPAAAPAIGRVRLPGVAPVVDDAVDALLAACEIEVVEVVLPGFQLAADAGRTVLLAEAWSVNGQLYAADPASVGEDLRERFEAGRRVTEAQLAAARRVGEAWRRELAGAFARTPMLAWPTLPELAAPIDGPVPDTRTTNVPVNLAGHPALALPAPTAGALPASVQLVGPDDSEELLCATGLVLESAARTLA